MRFRGKSKGQFSIEYLVAFLLFASVILYLSFQVAGVLPSVRKSSQRNMRISKAHRITEELIRTEGYPGNWENIAGDPEKYGLAHRPYVLHKDKVQDFNSSCNSDYELVKEKLGLNLNDFKIVMYNVSSGTEIIDCGKSRIPKGVSVEEFERYCIFRGYEMRMVLKIW
jgi:hypothetical protein